MGKDAKGPDDQNEDQECQRERAVIKRNAGEHVGS